MNQPNLLADKIKLYYLSENFIYDTLCGIALQTPYKDISHNFQITPMSDGKALLSKTLILKSEQANTKALTIIQFMKHESAKLIN